MLLPTPSNVTSSDANGTYTGLGLISSNVTIYVATTGNDTTGTGTSGAPFATIQKAMSYLQGFTIASNATVTVSIGSGTFSQTSTINLYHPCGSRLFITGTTTATSNTPSSITTSNTTTFTWSGTNVTYGIVLTQGSVLGGLSNLCLIGGTSGSKNTGNALQVQQNSSITSGSMISLQYWYIGVAAYYNGNVNIDYIAATGITVHGIASYYGSYINGAGLYSIGNAYGFTCVHNSSILAISSTATGNSAYGYYANMGEIDASSSVCNTNSVAAYGATNGATILIGSAIYSGTVTPAVGNVGNNNSIVIASS